MNLFSVFRRKQPPSQREPWVRRPVQAPGKQRDTENLPPVSRVPSYPLRQPPSAQLLDEHRVIPALIWCRENGLPPIRRQSTGEISLRDMQLALPAPVTPPDWLVSAIPERFQVDDDPTVAREEPALYQLQRLARARQREMSRDQQ